MRKKIVSSSQNIDINEFVEELDKDEAFIKTNIVLFVGQIFLSEEEIFVFYERYISTLFLNSKRQIQQMGL